MSRHFESKTDFRAEGAERIIAPLASLRPPEPSLFMKVAGKAVSKFIYCLDTLQVRGHVQRAATALLPRRFLEELKASR